MPLVITEIGGFTRAYAVRSLLNDQGYNGDSFVYYAVGDTLLGESPFAPVKKVRVRFEVVIPALIPFCFLVWLLI